MDLFKKLKQLVYSACLYFTAAEFVVLIAAALFYETAPENGGEVVKFLNLSSAASILLCAFIMSALNFIWKLNYGTAAKVFIHFVGSLAAFSILFIIVPGVWDNMAQIFVRLGIFAVIYFIIAFIVMITHSIVENKRANKLDYTDKFGKS